MTSRPTQSRHLIADCINGTGGHTWTSDCCYCWCISETKALCEMIVKCSKPTCENPVTPEGVCCPLCPGRCSRRNPCLNGRHGIGGGAGGKEVVPPPPASKNWGGQHPPHILEPKREPQIFRCI